MGTGELTPRQRVVLEEMRWLCDTATRGRVDYVITDEGREALAVGGGE